MLQTKHMFAVFLLLLFGDFCLSQATDVNNTRIVGGVEVVPLSWPWMAYIEITHKSIIFGLFSTTFSCGASLINSQYILTAAHCVRPPFGYLFSSAKITLGAHNLKVKSGKEVVMYSTQSKVYPLYITTPDPRNDIALLKLNSTVDFNAFSYLSAVTPAANDASTTYNPNNCIATGWGVTSDGSNTLSDTLQQVVLPILPNSYCFSSYGLSFSSNNMLCAGYETGGKDTCQGDSGGPLVCKTPSNSWALAGITSFGDGCAQPNKPGVYTRVSAFNTWIQNNAN